MSLPLDTICFLYFEIMICIPLVVISFVDLWCVLLFSSDKMAAWDYNEVFIF